MENINIKTSEKTPKVFFNYLHGVLEIKGYSIPEDAYQFYQPLLGWLDDYSTNPHEKTILNIQLDYFNTSSSMYIVAILKKIEELALRGNQVIIKWYCYKDDDIMLQSGQDLSLLLKTPMEIVEMDDEKDFFLRKQA